MHSGMRGAAAHPGEAVRGEVPEGASPGHGGVLQVPPRLGGGHGGGDLRQHLRDERPAPAIHRGHRHAHQFPKRLRVLGVRTRHRPRPVFPEEGPRRGRGDGPAARGLDPALREGQEGSGPGLVVRDAQGN